MGDILTRRTARLVALTAITVAALAGCTEVYKGPRVVDYTETSFYIRHIPVLNSDETANEIAAALCSRGNRAAVLTDAYQDVPLDIRYATYECI
ncbi:MAG: hypothetical protein JNM75_00650 [Rhodospirillales bacterium]|nr:hypothetical protein [Rhodospirillales bacterium]